MKDAIMGKLCLYMAWAIALCLSCQTSATVVDFEDLTYGQDISGSSYKELYWEFGTVGLNSNIGTWINPYASDPDFNYFNFPSSGTHNLSNGWGCSEIGFKFPIGTFEDGVTVNGAYFAVQGDMDLWAQSIIVKGYKDDVELWVTDPLMLTETPQWLSMDDLRVDRVMIFVTPAEGNDYGWFGMDDLTLDRIVPEPATLLLLTLGAALLRRQK